MAQESKAIDFRELLGRTASGKTPQSRNGALRQIKNRKVEFLRWFRSFSSTEEQKLKGQFSFISQLED